MGCGRSPRWGSKTVAVPNGDPLLENLDVFWVGYGLNLDNGGSRGMLAWAERIAKGKW